ncbi:MAG: cation transporter [Dehalococcoidaceae bacterium]|nr:cation transporter [Dehalococcoidaceae bacterium]
MKADSGNTAGFFKSKEGAGIVAMAATGLLIVMKLAGSAITGSISIRADAIHSIIDFSGAVIGFTGIKIASRPPDKGHAFGHGKAESIAGAIIGTFILAASLFIGYEAVSRLVSASPVNMVEAGIYITITAIAVNMLVSWYGLKIARDTDSIALEATSRDLLADSLSSVAVLVGLILVRLTGNNIFDSIVALLVSVVILRTALITVFKSLNSLMDNRLPPREEEIIRSVITGHQQTVSFHDLRTRKSGSERHIDLHLELPANLTVLQAHRVCDELEAKIQSKLPGSNIVIHIEPRQQKS